MGYDLENLLLIRNIIGFINACVKECLMGFHIYLLSSIINVDYDVLC